jgi:peptide/nickel transport system permease protein
MREPRIAIGGTILGLLFAIALAAPLLAPHPPNDQDLLNALLPPAWTAGGHREFLFGTDSLGRDVLSRLIYGTRVAMTVAFGAALGAAALGCTLALIAGYFRGWVDWCVSRALEVWLSFPPVILSLILMVGLGVGLRNVVLAIVLVDWTRFCRVIRSEVLVVCKRDYIPAARLFGFTDLQVIVKEVFPAVLPLLLTLFSIELGIAVIVEATLSFIGLSVEPSLPAWGAMIAQARQYIYQSVWLLIFPVLAIFATVFGANVLGDGLRRRLDPVLVERIAVER